jgi:osmotically-inducible protein OsmY
VKPDAEIREDVTGELHWDPQVSDPEAIGVAVKDGAVTLTGAVPTYGEGLAAVRAASGVYGVKAVAGELRVRLAGEPRDDSDIARAIAHVPEWNTQIPEGRVMTGIEEAFRREAEVDARHIQVEMSDHTAELHGLVHSLSEAVAVPVVGRVESHLVVSP